MSAFLGARWPLRAGTQTQESERQGHQWLLCSRQRPCLGVFSLQAFSTWGVHPIILQEKSGRRLRASVPSGYFLTGRMGGGSPLYLQKRLLEQVEASGL